MKKNAPEIEEMGPWINDFYAIPKARKKNQIERAKEQIRDIIEPIGSNPELMDDLVGRLSLFYEKKDDKEKANNAKKVLKFIVEQFEEFRLQLFAQRVQIYDLEDEFRKVLLAQARSLLA